MTLVIVYFLKVGTKIGHSSSLHLLLKRHIKVLKKCNLTKMKREFTRIVKGSLKEIEKQFAIERDMYRNFKMEDSTM